MTSSGPNEKWDRLVADLQEPRTRRAARQKLVAAGAVEPLLGCLKHNMNIPAGAFALRDVGGEPQVVMVDTMLASTVTPGALAKHIENIAARADRVEERLTSKDRY